MFEPQPRPVSRHHHRDPRRGPDNLPFFLRDVLGRGRGGRPIRRGEIRPLILRALTRKPMHGYEVIQELEQQSGGRWRPSAGSVYPTLQQLADEGLVTSEEVEGRRTYTLTEEGQAAAAAAPTRPRWSDARSDGDVNIRQLALQVAGAVMQVQRVGSPRARAEAQRVLVDARRQLYRLLAEDEDAAPGDDPDPS